MITPFGIIGIIIGITNLAIGCLVYLGDRKNKTKQLWALFAVSVSIWGFGAYLISPATMRPLPVHLRFFYNWV
jgi:hypothetical protein